MITTTLRKLQIIKYGRPLIIHVLKSVYFLNDIKCVTQKFVFTRITSYDKHIIHSYNQSVTKTYRNAFKKYNKI